MSEHYPDGHNLGPGAVYDTPDEKEIARLERKVKGLQMALAASDASLNEYIEKTKAAEAALRSARPEVVQKQDWLVKMDSVEGRALTAEAIIASIERKSPELIATAREEVCRPPSLEPSS